VAVTGLSVSGSRVVLVTAERCVCSHRWVTPKADAAFTFSSAAAEMGYGVEADLAPPRALAGPLAPEADASLSVCCAIMPGGRVVVSCGYWDNSLRCLSVCLPVRGYWGTFSGVGNGAGLLSRWSFATFCHCARRPRHRWLRQ
jgi:hypothetical protein